MFGVTPEVVSEWVNGLVFRDASAGPPVVQATSPSRAACVVEIQQAGQIVAGEFTRLGGTVPTDPTTAGYALARRMLLLMIASWADRARQRVDPDLAKVYAEDLRAIREEIARNTSALMDARGTGPRSPGLARPSEYPYTGPRPFGARLWQSGQS